MWKGRTKQEEKAKTGKREEKATDQDAVSAWLRKMTRKDTMAKGQGRTPPVPKGPGPPKEDSLDSFLRRKKMEVVNNMTEREKKKKDIQKLRLRFDVNGPPRLNGDGPGPKLKPGGPNGRRDRKS